MTQVKESWSQISLMKSMSQVHDADHNSLQKANSVLLDLLPWGKHLFSRRRGDWTPPACDVVCTSGWERREGWAKIGISLLFPFYGKEDLRCYLSGWRATIVFVDERHSHRCVTLMPEYHKSSVIECSCWLESETKAHIFANKHAGWEFLVPLLVGSIYCPCTGLRDETAWKGKDWNFIQAIVLGWHLIDSHEIQT